jgi:hypothetical protein
MPPPQITVDEARGKPTFLSWIKMKGGDETNIWKIHFSKGLGREEERLLKQSSAYGFACWELSAKRWQGNERQQNVTIDSHPKKEKGVAKGSRATKGRDSLTTRGSLAMRGREVTRVSKVMTGSKAAPGSKVTRVSSGCERQQGNVRQ